MELEGLKKTWLLIVFMLVLVSAACSNSGTSGTSSSEGEESTGTVDKSKEIKIGYIPWDEDVAVTYLWKYLLEEKGYKVNATLADVAPVFTGVAQGSIDLFLDVWMPSTHSTYMEDYGKDLEVLGTWYDEADNGLAVPDYMDIQSIEEVKDLAGDLDSKIVGIEPGAGLMRLSREAMPEYGLEDWTLVESSTPAMLAELEKAVADQKPIVVTLWRPHWAFEAYNLRYLEDPQNMMNPNGIEELQSISRKGFADDYPEVAEWISNFKISLSDLATLESAIKDASDEMDGVEKWVSEHQDVADGWVE
ncbi:glycine betaine ABC transporter substrate-binding protein [Robertmurraya kyonggiensis]|uniref:Glycine betaine ABC transporter substrate-binding protein n=1 Tax=Robertmurraya kyonggiensis TaxID=1037680 RepID=A0A4U1D590_9BACI|nr:glycine betaine ABC transporter substrate-binding protein [Robertmurraya kyonggiensis]